VKVLAEFTSHAPPSIDADLHPEYLLLSRPFLPRPWLISGRKTRDPEREFPRRGQVHLPHEAFARDSGYAFYISSLMAGEGDPGRFTEELRKEHKNRRAGVLLSLAQVEYYHLPPGLRKSFCIRRHQMTGRSGNVRQGWPFRFLRSLFTAEVG
jgi:hypothetical protein